MTTGGFEERAEVFLEEHWKPLATGFVGFVLLGIGVAVGSSGSAIFGVVLLVAAGAMAYQSLPAPSVGAVERSTVPVSDSVRQERLQQVLSHDVAVNRGRVESVTPYTAVVVTGRRVNHVLHLLVSVLLCGLWLPVWLLISVGGGEKRHVLTVDQFGNVSRR